MYEPFRAYARVHRECKLFSSKDREVGTCHQFAASKELARRVGWAFSAAAGHAQMLERSDRKRVYCCVKHWIDQHLAGGVPEVYWDWRAIHFRLVPASEISCQSVNSYSDLMNQADNPEWLRVIIYRFIIQILTLGNNAGLDFINQLSLKIW